MYKFTYVSSDSGDWNAWYLDGEKLVEGHKITALDLMDVIRHVFPHKLEIAYVQDEIVEMGLSESLGDICEIDSELEAGAWKEFKGCIRMPDPLNTSNELYSKLDKDCKNCVNSKRVKMENGKFTYPCQLGYDIYMGCQEAGSIDYFEPKKERKKK